MTYRQVTEWSTARDADYEEPAPPAFETRIHARFSGEPPLAGRATWDEVFSSDFDETECSETTRVRHFLAHGSYGLASRAAVAASVGWTRSVERNPVAFFYKTLYPRLVRSLRAAAAFTHADPSGCVLVANVEEGFACVWASLSKAWNHGDRVIAFDLGYSACLAALRKVCLERGCHLVLIDTVATTSETGITRDSVLHAFKQTVETQLQRTDMGPIRMAFFEHITSPTALVLPIEEIISTCREHGILSLVDGAHGIGQIDLHLDALAPDFYVTNMHKWLCNTRGSALLYIHPTHRTKIHPLITTWGSLSTEGLHAEFIWQGTANHSAHLSLYTAVRLMQWLARGDPARLFARNTCLTREAGRVLTYVWATEPLTRDENMVAAMVCVRIPPRLAAAQACETEACGVSDLHDDLLEKLGIECPVFTFRGKRYVRVSSHVYNDMQDVFALAEGVLRSLGYPDNHVAFQRLQEERGGEKVFFIE
ncbi:pyridoxal phosphate-dependent transferase [Chytriomyces sp. MP71]|nr:pyridoxal phosphate-dependent transferase [Chytriomyces sp. MP71]